MSSEYPFVVVTHPGQLKDERTRRVIRRTVMHDYMRKESQKASSTDPRIVRRRLRTSTHVRDEPDEAQCTEELSPPELSGSSSTASRSSSDSSRPAMGHSLGHNETVINPLIMPEPIQDELASLVNGIRHFSISSDAVASKTYLDPLWERIRPEKHDHFISALVYQHEDITRLINRDHNAVSPVNLDLLKAVCGAYYSSTACNRQWTHLLLESPEAYLSALCLVAPFTDLMIMGEVWNGDDPSKYLRQTLEVLNVVPRMINDRIKAPDKSHDDHTAIAIAQLLSCQLATPHHSHLSAHRKALKDI
ncbi:hypothetical protein B9Z65_7218 [Elsinoe australis]|uniref:Uncharacterized protein n=1 Tax=Elsinoe australis TaxID=40998 RepID=A0A2P7Z667_9PEZI|nr:hypothetical protein B9Z65_7218 [Elsinoe australis]